MNEQLRFMRKALNGKGSADQVAVFTDSTTIGGSEELTIDDNGRLRNLNKPVVTEAPQDGKVYGRRDAGWQEVKGGATTIIGGGGGGSSGSGDGGQGPPGPQGPTGPAGSQGPTGPPGTDGAIGPAGPAGPTGATGAIGAPGPQGPAGADGAGAPGTAPPIMDGTATVGTSLLFSRQDHIHPTDTSRAAASAIPAGAIALPLASAASAVVGVSAKYAREDHVHPSDATKIDSIVVSKFFASGTYTPTAGMKYCIIECIGAGGGGGGPNAIPNYSVGGGGGASGSYSRFLASAAQVGVSKVVTIGAQGVGGGAAVNGGNGGATSVGTLCSATGGGGGTFGATTYPGDGGGVGAYGSGDINWNGMPGFGGIGGLTTSLYGQGGNGGSSIFGGGGKGQMSGGSLNGGSALSIGGGGAGGISTGGAGAASGGNGAQGAVFITEFCSS
jgi:hypothetical protein